MAAANPPPTRVENARRRSRLDVPPLAPRRPARVPSAALPVPHHHGVAPAHPPPCRHAGGCRPLRVRAPRSAAARRRARGPGGAPATPAGRPRPGGAPATRAAGANESARSGSSSAGEENRALAPDAGEGLPLFRRIAARMRNAPSSTTSI